MGERHAQRWYALTARLRRSSPEAPCGAPLFSEWEVGSVACGRAAASRCRAWTDECPVPATGRRSTASRSRLGLTTCGRRTGSSRGRSSSEPGDARVHPLTESAHRRPVFYPPPRHVHRSAQRAFPRGPPPATCRGNAPSAVPLQPRQSPIRRGSGRCRELREAERGRKT